MVTKKKLSVKKSVAPKKKQLKTVSVSQPKRVDYYPNRMTFAVSSLAVISLVLLCLMASYGLR